MDNPSISLTNAAVAAIQAQLQKRNTLNAFLRIGIKGGSCEGFSYVIEFFDGEPKPTDHIFSFDDIKVIVDKKSMIYLNGTTLDYEKTLMKQGFVFTNPQEKSRCGCGNSFSVR